jgi:hypothetical protein
VYTHVYTQKKPIHLLPKDEYKIEVHKGGYWAGVRLKKLELDYCVAWQVSKNRHKSFRICKYKIFIELKTFGANIQILG